MHPDPGAMREPEAGPMRLPPLQERPLVSILMANYNYAHFVGQAIESVLGQTYPDFELIVCDDGSEDGSAEVIEGYARRDPRVALVRKVQNGGMAAAWNTVYPRSRGQILCLLDADDLFEPTKLGAVVDHFRGHADDGLLIHPMLVIDRDGGPIQRIPGLTRFEEGWIAARVVRRGGRWRYMPTSALAFRREAVGRVFPIPEAIFRRTADGYLFTLLPLLTRVGAVGDALGRYRVHGQNGMSSLEFDLKTAKRLVDARHRVTEGVNGRLAELGLDCCRIDIRRNLNFLEHAFSVRLLEGDARRHLLKDYALLGRSLWTDDLYGWAQKVLGLVVYGSAVLLPTGLRPRWLTFTLRHNRIKDRLRRLLGGPSGRRAWRREVPVGGGTR